MDGDTVFAVGLMKRQLNDMERSRDEWRLKALQVTQTLQNLQALVAQKDAALKAFEAELAKVDNVLARTAAHAAGLEAQRDAFLAQHPDSPLLQDSGKRFKDGDVKTRVRLLYKRAHDARGRELGISDPAACRID